MPRCSRSRIAILTPTPEFGVVIKIPETGARCDLGKRGCSEQPRTDRVPKPNQNRIRTKKNPEGRRRQPRPRKNHRLEPPHVPPPSTPAYDTPPAETATACTTEGRGHRQKRDSQRRANAWGNRGRARGHCSTRTGRLSTKNPGEGEIPNRPSSLGGRP